MSRFSGLGAPGVSTKDLRRRVSLFLSHDDKFRRANLSHRKDEKYKTNRSFHDIIKSRCESYAASHEK